MLRKKETPCQDSFTRYYTQFSQDNSDPPVESSLQDRLEFDWTNYVQYGENYPDWKLRLATGNQCTTHMSGTRTTISARRGSVVFDFEQGSFPFYSRRRYGATGQLVFVSTNPGYLPSASNLDIADNIAREKFYSKVHSATTAFQSGIFLGELRESLRMIRNPARALRQGLDLYLNNVTKKLPKFLADGKRYSKKRQKRRADRMVQDTWLEYSFGWVPLVNDLENAYEALRRNSKFIAHDIVVVNSEGVIKEEEIVGPNEFGYTYDTVRWTEKRDLTTSVRYKGGVLNATINPHTRKLNHWGISSSEILPTLWELTPYSFLVDYFTNIGDLIESHTQRTVGLSWGVRTERRETIASLFDFRHSFPNHNPLVRVRVSDFSPGDMVMKNVSFWRDPINSVGLPTFRFKLPGFSTKWLNMAALIRKSTKFSSLLR